jgi:N-acyl-D-amino-acid deacylase
VNVAGLVGHTTLRRDVLRDEIRDAKEDELEQMQALLHRALEDGAYGISFGLSYSHARGASREELVALAKQAREAGTLVAIHLRDERELQAEAVGEALELAKEVDASVEISHLKSVGDEAGSTYKAAVAAIEKAAGEHDLDVHFSVFPFETQHAVLYLLFPEWAQKGGFDELRKRLQDAATRQKIVHELGSMNIPFEDYVIAEAKRGKSSVGKTILEAAKYANVSPAEFIVNLFLAHEGQVLLFHRCKGESHLAEALAHPLAHVTSAGGGYALGDVESGALVHPRSFGAMPELLGHYVREKKALKLEEAVKKISGAPAAKLGMVDRGTLAEGNVADITVFDPKTIANVATLEKPYQFPNGMKWVLVNGAISVDPDGVTGRRAGKALRRSA